MSTEAGGRTFHVVDYVVFTAMLLASAGIGIFYALSGGRQKTTGEFFMGNRKLKTLPVATSLLVSFLSALGLLGTPAETYFHGSQYLMHGIGVALGAVLAAWLFVPLLYPLKIVSVYEYLELRFQSKAARWTGTFIQILSGLLYMGFAMLAPSVALEAVTGFPVWASVILVGAVATFYTALGGMKAVIWTDVFQSIFMLGGVITIIVLGCLHVGGLGKVWEIAERGGRTKVFDFDLDPTKRQTFWSLVIGGAVMWFGIYGGSQASVQRYSSLPTQKRAVMSILFNIPGYLIYILLTTFLGIVIYAYYADLGCDPKKAGRISNVNQIVPYFVMEVVGYPGIPGLFVACLFSGALSTVSSYINANCAIVWEDVLVQWYSGIPEKKKTLINKILTILLGMGAMATAFLAQNIGGTFIQLSIGIVGAAGGPLLGMQLLGAAFPWANGKGVVVGGFSALAFSLWISLGQNFLRLRRAPLPVPTAMCWALNSSAVSGMEEMLLSNGALYLSNSTMATSTMATSVMTTMFSGNELAVNSTIPSRTISGLDHLYTISYQYFSAIGTVMVIIVGLIVSFITGPSSSQDIDERLILPCLRRFFYGKDDNGAKYKACHLVSDGKIHGDIVRDLDSQGRANHWDLSLVKTPVCNGVTPEHAQENGRDYSLDPDSATYLLVDELQRGDSEGIDAAENCDEEDQASKSLKGEVQSADSLKGGVQSEEPIKDGVQSEKSIKGGVQSEKSLKNVVQGTDSLKGGVRSGESPNRVENPRELSPKGEVASSHLHKAVSNGVCDIPTNDQNEPSEEHIGNKSTVAVEVAPPASNTRTTRL